VARKWQYHPSATKIAASGLKSDFRKVARPADPDHEELAVHIEAQFGNMSRWYSDVFKFQTAYSQDLIGLGICIVPVGSLAKRIDQNLAHYERVCRELPHAKMSITLPILVIGLEPDEHTTILDLSLAKISPKAKGPASGFTGQGTAANRYRILKAFRDGTPLNQVTDTSDPGEMPAGAAEDEDDTE
jgi:hypothetical protein